MPDIFIKDLSHVDSERFNLAYYGLYLCDRGPANKPGASTEWAMFASFYLSRNIEDLFPYINAVADRSELYWNPTLIKFRLDKRYCVLYPEYGLATPFNEKIRKKSWIWCLMPTI